MTTLRVTNRLGAIGTSASRFARPLRDALVVVGIGRAIWFFFVQGIRPWEFLGVDARAYWRIDLADPYANSAVGEISTYLYSPAFAQAMAPFGALPFPAFFALWTALSVVLLVWLVRPWPWAVPILALPIIYELCVGNVHFLIAAAIVLGFRFPSALGVPDPHQDHARRRRRVVPRAPRVARVRDRRGDDGRHRGRVVRAHSHGVGGLDRLPARLARAQPAPGPARRPGRRPRRVRRPHGPTLAGPGCRLDLPAIVWINSWVILLAMIRLRNPQPPAPLRAEGR